MGQADAEEREEEMKTYQEITFGYDEPQIMWLTGATVKELEKSLGNRIACDSNGDLIRDEELYVLTKEGIYPA